LCIISTLQVPDDDTDDDDDWIFEEYKNCIFGIVQGVRHQKNSVFICFNIYDTWRSSLVLQKLLHAVRTTTNYSPAVTLQELNNFTKESYALSTTFTSGISSVTSEKVFSILFGVPSPTLLESPGFLGVKFPGPGESWNFECKVLESPGIF